MRGLLGKHWHLVVIGILLVSASTLVACGDSGQAGSAEGSEARRGRLSPRGTLLGCYQCLTPRVVDWAVSP